MIVKLIFKTFVMLFVLLGIGSYGMYLTTGRTPFSLGGLLDSARQAIPQEFSGSTVSAPEVESSSGNSSVLKTGTIRVYKWQDELGQWHYGEKPPEDQAAESMLINRDLNVVAGVRPPAEEPAPQDLGATDSGMPDGNPYTPDNVKKMFEDAKNLQTLMDARNKAQEALMNQ